MTEQQEWLASSKVLNYGSRRPAVSGSTTDWSPVAIGSTTNSRNLYMKMTDCRFDCYVDSSRNLHVRWGSGKMEQWFLENADNKQWTLQMYIWDNPTVKTIYPGPYDPGDPELNADWIMFSRHVTHAQDPSGQSTRDYISIQSAQTDKRLGNIDTLLDNGTLTLEQDAHGLYISLWISGLILFEVSTSSNPVTITPTELRIYGIEKYLDYYPWERKISAAWKSLNRDGGPSSQRNTGLFRKANSKWEPVSNTEANDATKQHGFRYNNGWQKSPKSGQGA